MKVGAINSRESLLAQPRLSAGSAVPTGRLVTFEASAVAWTPELSRLAFLLTGDQEEAEDLVADALFAAWQKWPKVAEATNPRAYVRRIVTNMAATRVRTKIRDRARQALLAPLTADTAPDSDVSADLDLQRALRGLPRRQRECVILRYGMDLSVHEVAEVLKISVGTVKSNASKGSQRLRSLLDEGVVQT